MAEEVANDPAPAPQEKKGKKKKAAKPKKPATHPKYSEMIKQALSNLKERGGIFQAGYPEIHYSKL